MLRLMWEGLQLDGKLDRVCPNMYAGSVLDLEPGTEHEVRLTLADPDGNIRAESEGICRGRIREEPVGSAGFGYDPLFEVVEYHRTFGQLGATVKGVLSHRARAVALMIPQIRRLLHEVAA